MVASAVPLPLPLQRPRPPALHPKARDFVHLQIHCLLSPTTSVIDFGQIDKLEARSTSSPSCVIKPLAYVGAVGPPTKTGIQMTLASDKLLSDEEAVISAAAAEAVALAREALELAKNAAKMMGMNPFVEVENLESSSDAEIKWLERMSLIGTELGGTNHFADAETEYPQANFSPDQFLHTDCFSFTYSESQMTEHAESIAVGSVRLTERRARRARAAEKATAGVTSLKSGLSGRKKRSMQEVDYSDPLRYLRGTTNTTRLLTAAEEIRLSEGIQDLLKLERLKETLAERNGCQPTFAQWAAAAGVDPKSLRKRLTLGTFSKDKMITSNIRLVISIAKNYLGTGLNIQDLVQEGCRGLVRGAEKFDASKGFKFSTYAHWWIKQSVRKFLSEHSRTIRLPYHMVEASYRVREAEKRLHRENGRHPGTEEVAVATGLSMKKLEAVMLTPKALISLDQKIGFNESLKPTDVIAHPDAETSEDMLIKQFMRQDLNKVLDTLNPKEKQVVRWRFGLEDGRMKTLQEIGELMGVSRERVRQIESSALRKLKSKKRTNNLRQYIVT
ncbi:RNA polymerase sigma factor sigB-like isoform X1 [Zingiber officinale]|uniref:RNA polymerase sigma factor sigB-like isoform X1 n=2 Tax=Zingiber officinale TaxID=94328 RepID=UPI001C4D39DA|nr:RNA polymerase sigma factor sigB-like isoform X1 [Zingiber officinale]